MMRKFIGIAFILAGYCSLAFLPEQGRFSHVRFSGSLFADVHQDISAGTISLPHTEIEFSHIQNDSQASRQEPRKSPLQLWCVSQQATVTEWPTSGISITGNGHIKQHLTHNHPTHHFW